MTDHDAIRNVLGRYCQLLDDGEYDAWSELFATEGVYVALGAPKLGRAAVREFIESYPAEVRRESRHLTTNSVIEVEGDNADAISDFFIVRRTRGGGIFVRGGRYSDRLVKEAGRWLFAERRISSKAWHPPTENISHAYLEDWSDPSPNYEFGCDASTMGWYCE